MNNSPFRVAFWGLLAGFGLSIALAATDPAEIRLALETPPPADLDDADPRTLLADRFEESPPREEPGAEEEATSRLIAEADGAGDQADILPIDVSTVTDNRLALDADRPILVPPFDGETTQRPVPNPPQTAEKPTIEFNAPDNEGVPIEFDLEGSRPRIHVVVSPPRPREFVELPAPPQLAQIDGALDDEGSGGPRMVPLPVPLEEGGIVSIPSTPEPILDRLVNGPETETASMSPSAEQLDELRSLFKQEMRSLRDEVQSMASLNDLVAKRADFLEAQQQLDREHSEQQFALLRQDLDRLREESRPEPVEQVQVSESPRVIVTPSICQPGRIDVELNSAPAAEAFSCLGRLAGQNLLTRDDVQGNVTAKLMGVTPWEAVLALVQSRNCRIVSISGGLMVVPAERE